MAVLFFSYSHVDEGLRDQLEVHLAALQRQGFITSWHDRRITAGSELDGAIDTQLDAADIILLLISPNFIASDYCYNREMTRAMERHHRGEARVIPVILRTSDWRGLPFGKLMAAPKDALPVTKWPNIDDAFHDVVIAIKSALKEIGEEKLVAVETPKAIESPPLIIKGPIGQTYRSSNLRVRKHFTDQDKDLFRHEGFEYIGKFFENSLKELVDRNVGLAQTFRRLDHNRFTAVVYQAGRKVCKGSISCGVSSMSSDAIEYSMTDVPRHGGMNEAVTVEDDDQALYFKALGMNSYGREKEKLTPQGAAELSWQIFIAPLQG